MLKPFIYVISGQNYIKLLELVSVISSCLFSLVNRNLKIFSSKMRSSSSEITLRDVDFKRTVKHSFIYHLQLILLFFPYPLKSVRNCPETSASVVLNSRQLLVLIHFFRSNRKMSSCSAAVRQVSPSSTQGSLNLDYFMFWRDVSDSRGKKTSVKNM